MNTSPALNLLIRLALDKGKTHTAFINAFSHPLLNRLRDKSFTCCLVQTLKPAINALQLQGLDVSLLKGKFDLILLLPGKDKVQSLSWMATAFDHLNDDGQLLVACENQYGAKSYESALKRLAGAAASQSKAKCRIFSARKTEALNRVLQQEWLQAGQVQQLPSHGLWSQAGLFSWKSPDIGSTLLLKNLPILKGKGMDLCCGYGLLASAILKTSPAIQRLYMVEAEALALDCAKQNVTGMVQLEFYHLDAAHEALPKHLDWIVCNPPFHTGQTRDVELGQTIVTRACDSLKYGGVLYLVANRQLPYENILQTSLSKVETLAVGRGFKVIRGSK